MIVQTGSWPLASAAAILLAFIASPTVSHAHGDHGPDTAALVTLCETGDHPQACVLAGRAKLETARDAALALLAKACDAGYGLACGEQGAAIYNAATDAKGRAEAEAPWTKGCEAKNGRSCYGLGNLHRQGDIGPKDEAKAFDLARQACELGSYLGCDQLGTAYEQGLGVAKDEAKAKDAFARRVAASASACNSGRARACYWAGDDYFRGTFVEKSLATSTAYLARGCALGSTDACNDYGVALREGDGIETNLPLSTHVFERSCERGNGSSCQSLMLAYLNGRGVEASAERADAVMRQVCVSEDRGILGTCHAMGHYLWDQTQYGFEADRKRAQAYFQIACDKADDKDACSHVEDLKAGRDKPTIDN